MKGGEGGSAFGIAAGEEAARFAEFDVGVCPMRVGTSPDIFGGFGGGLAFSGEELEELCGVGFGLLEFVAGDGGELGEVLGVLLRDLTEAQDVFGAIASALTGGDLIFEDRKDLRLIAEGGEKPIGEVAVEVGDFGSKRAKVFDLVGGELVFECQGSGVESQGTIFEFVKEAFVGADEGGCKGTGKESNVRSERSKKDRGQLVCASVWDAGFEHRVFGERLELGCELFEDGVGALGVGRGVSLWLRGHGALRGFGVDGDILVRQGSLESDILVRQGSPECDASDGQGSQRKIKKVRLERRGSWGRYQGAAASSSTRTPT